MFYVEVTSHREVDLPSLLPAFQNLMGQVLHITFEQRITILLKQKAAALPQLPLSTLSTLRFFSHPKYFTKPAHLSTFYRWTTQAAEKFTNFLWTRSSGSTKKKQQQRFLESQGTMPVVRRPASHAGGLARPLLGPTPHSSASMGPLAGRRQARLPSPGHPSSNTTSTARLLPPFVSSHPLLKRRIPAAIPGLWHDHKAPAGGSARCSLQCCGTEPGMPTQSWPKS